MMPLSIGRVGGALLRGLAGSALAFTAACEAAAAPKVHRIVVDEMKFAPAVHNLRAGDTVLWVNKGVLRHTATARDKSFNVDLPPSASRRLVIKSSGKVSFYCIYHPSMKGILNVAK